MRVAVALAVLVIRLVVRDERGEFLQDVVLHVRVGVLVDRDPGGRVGAVDVADAARHGLRQHAVDVLGDVDDLAVTAGLDGEFGHDEAFPFDVRFRSFYPNNIMRTWRVCKRKNRFSVCVRGWGSAPGERIRILDKKTEKSWFCLVVLSLSRHFY